MRVLITGIAGFIGSNLADILIKQDYEVSGIDNFETGRKENLNNKIRERFLEADISSQSDLINSFFEYVKLRAKKESIKR